MFLLASSSNKGECLLNRPARNLLANDRGIVRMSPQQMAHHYDHLHSHQSGMITDSPISSANNNGSFSQPLPSSVSTHHHLAFLTSLSTVGARNAFKSRHSLTNDVRTRVLGRSKSSSLTVVDLNAPWLTVSNTATRSLMQPTSDDQPNNKSLPDVPDETNVISPHRPQLAGQLFSADLQCRLVFGAGSRICPYMPKCGRLWCTSEAHDSSSSIGTFQSFQSNSIDFENSKALKGLAGLSRSAAGSSDGPAGCKTQQMPWADGSECASGHWCIRGQCKPINESMQSRSPVHGDWSQWSPWTNCSRPCEGGIRSSSRQCDSPR